MKKVLLVAALLFLSGCVQKTQNSPQKEFSVDNDMKILEKYNIAKNRLHKVKNSYFFFVSTPNGTFIYKLDKNLNAVMQKKVPLLIDAKKLKVFNNKIYLLGYAIQEKRPVLLTFDKNGNLLNKKFYGEKFNTPRDFIIDNGIPIIAINSYGKKTSTDITIYKDNKKYSFASPLAEEVNFIKKFQDGYLIGGDISQDDQNVLLIYTDKNFKTRWSLSIDYGADEELKKIKIKGDKIVLTILSQNYMGMEKSFTIIVDNAGKIVSKQKNYEIKDLPLKFHG